ncbi:hypothetical protein E1I69_16040 [Bacillus timonensis]|uniref:Uncharacterized protein n=1 Tax=Bacillus timonensis TaxID=1033734 RepID=A0A4S3PQW0_9BACI|nr:hypothetical protein [Bacillus timonensis]THE11152.1 hypothetical protein E1I69_16040 [Bacillus timonensis]
MKQVINDLKRKDGEKRLAVLRLEVDYELATLYDAMIENDEVKKAECKKKLQKLSKEITKLEA